MDSILIVAKLPCASSSIIALFTHGCLVSGIRLFERPFETARQPLWVPRHMWRFFIELCSLFVILKWQFIDHLLLEHY
jgi:hypothetical protein